MSKRKGWNELSASYRQRLERKGIARADYERGVSLSAARGHARTPERPSDAYDIKGRERHREYLQRAGELRKQVFDRKVRIFANRFKWNEERARKYVMEGGTEVKKPGIKSLQAALKMTDDEIDELLVDPDMDKEWRFLWYH